MRQVATIAQGPLFGGDWLKTDRLSQWPKLGTFVCSICYIVGDNPLPLSYGHTQLNPPHPVRSAQLNSWWHSQYYGGGPHGNTMCCSFLFLFFFFFFLLSFPPLVIEWGEQTTTSLSYTGCVRFACVSFLTSNGVSIHSHFKLVPKATW